MDSKEICSNGYAYCTGCGACMHICKMNAIMMERDSYGFYYPIIQQDRCINCSQCRTICEKIHNLGKRTAIKVYAGWAKSNKQHSWSTSGGIASTLNAAMMKRGWSVYGAKFVAERKEYQIKKMITNEDIILAAGSKYCQIPVFTQLEEIQKDLDNGGKVFFVGNPCQVNALKTVFSKYSDSLYTVDLICHGVPSQQFLFDELKEVVRQNDLGITDIRFREKDTDIAIYNNDSLEMRIPKGMSIYKRAFDFSLTCRESCMVCRYADSNRCGDLTLGDFWGLVLGNSVKNEVDKGVNLIFVNSEHGSQLISYIKSDICLYERELYEAVENNPQLNSPHSNYNRSVFFESYEKYGFFKSAINALLACESGYKKFASRIKYTIKVFILRKKWKDA